MDDDMVDALIDRYTREETSWHALLRTLVWSDEYSCGDFVEAMPGFREAVTEAMDRGFVLRLAELAVLDVIADCDDPAWERVWEVVVDRACRVDSTAWDVRFPLVGVVSSIVQLLEGGTTSVDVFVRVMGERLVGLAGDRVFGEVGSELGRLWEVVLALHVLGLEVSILMRHSSQRAGRR